MTNDQAALELKERMREDVVLRRQMGMTEGSRVTLAGPVVTYTDTDGISHTITVATAV